MQHLSEAEKKSFIEDLYEDSKGVMLVNDILNMQNSATDMGKELGKKTMAENPGVFEKYYKTFTSGKYLKYTDSLEQEMSLIKEIYEESEKVSSYGKYLKDIKDRKKDPGKRFCFSSCRSEQFLCEEYHKRGCRLPGLICHQNGVLSVKGSDVGRLSPGDRSAAAVIAVSLCRHINL